MKEKAEGISADAALPAAEAASTLKEACEKLEKLLKAHSRPSGSVKELDNIFDVLSER